MKVKISALWCLNLILDIHLLCTENSNIYSMYTHEHQVKLHTEYILWTGRTHSKWDQLLYKDTRRTQSVNSFQRRTEEEVSRRPLSFLYFWRFVTQLWIYTVSLFGDQICVCELVWWDKSFFSTWTSWQLVQFLSIIDLI